MWVVNKYTCKHLENGHEHHSLLPQAETRYHLYARKTEDKIRHVLRCYICTLPAGDTIRDPSKQDLSCFMRPGGSAPFIFHTLGNVQNKSGS